MEQSILISVIVPVYKVEAYLSRCVDSILAQTYRNLEILLVDDGSPDSCGKICDDYAHRDPRIRVIHKINGGLSSARNAGLDIARGQYIAFVDSDDWIEPEMYETMLAAAIREDVPLVCAGRYDVESKTGERKLGLCPAKAEVITGEETARRIFTWEGMDSAAWDKLYRRELFDSIRYPVGVVVEDVPVTYRLALKAGRVAMCDKPFVNYFHRPGSITTAAVSEKTFHFSRHTAMIYPQVCREYPALADAVRYQRIRSLRYDLLTLELADRESRETFREQYARSQRELKKHLGFIVKSPMFSRQEKLTDLLLGTGFYSPFRKLYHRIKRT